MIKPSGVVLEAQGTGRGRGRGGAGDEPAWVVGQPAQRYAFISAFRRLRTTLHFMHN